MLSKHTSTAPLCSDRKCSSLVSHALQVTADHSAAEGHTPVLTAQHPCRFFAASWVPAALSPAAPPASVPAWGAPRPEALFAVAFLISTPAPCIRGCSNAQHHQSKLIPDVCFCSCWLLLSILLEVFQPALMRCRARRAPKLFVCHSSGSTPQSTFLSKCCFLIPAPTDNRMLCCKAKQSNAAPAAASSVTQLQHSARLPCTELCSAPTEQCS